jgi:hypothetical protein
MKKSTLYEAKQEALRFISKIEKYEEKHAKIDGIYVYCSKESSAVRRSSMDLTRILADLRLGR